MKKILLLVVVTLLLTAGMAAAADDTSWLTIGGDYRFKYDMLKGTALNTTAFILGVPTPVAGSTVKDNSLFTNRFGLNIKADPMEDVVVKARLVMYKVWGSQDSTSPYFGGSGPFGTGGYFADRVSQMDGTSTHVPQDNTLRVDYAYATVNNIFEQPLWFSIGRRPSTGGIPGNLRENLEKIGTAGIPNILVDYAFDGATLGYAPDIAALPGFYGKLCYGRGFSRGFDPLADGTSNTIKNTEFYGVNVVPYDTDKLHVELQYNVGLHIFDNPNTPSTDLGDMHWVGGVVTGKVGDLNVFVSGAESKTEPNDNLSLGTFGLEWDVFGHPKENHTGNAIYVGGRYDMGTTKVGAEYNRGSKYWITMAPAADDVWTGKLGTRGSVYEVYLIQELNKKPISKKGKAFIRLGYQYYKFNYTYSNNWVGAPDNIGTANPQLFTQIKDAKDLYATFEVQF